MRKALIAAGTAAYLALAGCGTADDSAVTEQAATGPQAAFMQNVESKCGRAFRGSAAGGNAQLAGKELVLSIGDCAAGDPVTMALHANIGPLQVSPSEEVWDRSRRYSLMRADNGLALKIAEQAEDGTPGALNGTTATSDGDGSTTQQRFAIAGADTPLIIDMGSAAATLTVPDVGEQQGFTATFDYSDRVAAPPAAWGAEGG